MLSVSLKNKIEILGRDKRDRQKISCWDSEKLEMRAKAYFRSVKELKMYSSLSSRIKQCDGLKIFKRELKEYILNTIQYF